MFKCLIFFSIQSKYNSINADYNGLGSSYSSHRSSNVSDFWNRM